MINRILSENFKNYRLKKGLTQEQVAQALNVNSQTVSRWECATTLPDIITLAELARLYNITVDDFYKKQSVAYDNYAQRLSAVYEKTLDPSDFLHCILEFQKLNETVGLTTTDKWNLAATYHIMLCDCKEKALKWYDKTIEDGTDYFDEYYCMAYCYEDMGEYEKSHQTFMNLAQLLRQANYDVEADMAEEDGQKVLLKLNNK